MFYVEEDYSAGKNIKLNQFSVERCFLGRSRDQLLQRKLKFIRSRALLTNIHLCRDFQAIGDFISTISILMMQIFCISARISVIR